jgi:tight adherence protein C
MIGIALLLSLCLVVGVGLSVSALPHFRRPRLASRLDPYLQGLQPWRSRLTTVSDQALTPFPTAERLLRPILADGARLVDRWIGGSASVARRLSEAGRRHTLAQFRAEQVLWALLGFLTAIILTAGLLAALGRGASTVAVLGTIVVCSLGGALGRDWWLTHEVRQRHARMLAEFPMIADLLCLAITAGEAPAAAIERIVARTRGELSRELALLLADVRTGTSFTAALEQLAGRVPIPQVARFVDGLAVAVNRGTPLADVLRAQAADVREQHKRALLEAGGKKEVYMLIPVVFLILPVVVLFALYPSLFSLSQIAR